jgi:hypothetical protein
MVLQYIQLLANICESDLGTSSLQLQARTGHPPLVPFLPHGENPEIGNLSIFRILTSNLVSKILY